MRRSKHLRNRRKRPISCGTISGKPMKLSGKKGKGKTGKRKLKPQSSVSPIFRTNKRESVFQRDIESTASLAKQALSQARSNLFNEDPDQDYMKLLEHKVYSATCSLFTKSKDIDLVFRKKIYVVLTDNSLLQFKREPNSRVEILENLTEVIPLENIEEIKVERRIVIIFLGSRLGKKISKEENKKIDSFDTSKYLFVTRHVSLTKRLKLQLSFKSKRKASLFAKYLYFMSYTPTIYSLPTVNHPESSEFLTEDYDIDSSNLHDSLEPFLNLYHLQLYSKNTRIKDLSHISLRSSQMSQRKFFLEKTIYPLKQKSLFGSVPRTEDGFCFVANFDYKGKVQQLKSDLIKAKDVLEKYSDVYDKNLGLKGYINQEISLTVTFKNEGINDIVLYLKLERDLISYTRVVEDTGIYKLFLFIHSMTEEQKDLVKLSSFAFNILIWFLIVFIFNNYLLAFVIGVTLFYTFTSQLTILDRYLFDRYKPYFITSALILHKDQLLTPEDIIDSDTNNSLDGVTKIEQSLLKKVKERVMVSIIGDLDGFEKESYEYEVITKYLEDFRLLPYLRERNNNVLKTATLVKKAIHWRLENNTEMLLEKRVLPNWLLTYYTCPSFLRKYELDYPQEDSKSTSDEDKKIESKGFDKDEVYFRDVKFENYCVLFKAGGLKNKKVMNKMNNDFELMFHYFIWLSEYFKRDCEALHLESNGKIPNGFTIIVDLAKYETGDNLSALKGLEVAKQYLPTLILINPSIIFRVLVINTPVIFYAFWKSLKLLLPQEIIKRFEFRKEAGESRTLEFLLKYMSEEQIPKYYGGKNEINGDKLCSDKIFGRGAIDIQAARVILTKKRKKK